MTISILHKIAWTCDHAAPCLPAVCKGSFMQAAFARTAAAIEPPAASASATTTTKGSLTGIRVCITSDNDTLGPDTSEDYNLTISSTGGGILTATSIYGALHGLGSLSQLVERSTHSIMNAPIAIEDRPRFGYRGLLVDTGRHFLPLSFLKHVVDGLAANKLNVMHWHIVDFQSFPCGSDTFPALAEKGAYSYPAAHFSPDNMRELVAYAKARGVRIMPEWDVPGHSAFGYAFPELMACPSAPGEIGVLDPTQDATYDMLNKFFAEMMTIFTDPYVFLGGDEVNTAECFAGNPRIAKWMAAHNVTADGVQQYFWSQMTAKVLPSALKGRTINIWEADNMQIDPTTLPKGTVANGYQSKKTADITIGEYKMPSTLSIASQQWYLDSQPSGYNQNSWEKRYMVEPTSNLTKLPENRPLLLGGEGAMWGEGINQDNFDAYVWRGMAAIGERLWSPAALTPSVAAALGRLSQHVCRMTWDGFRPGPVEPGFCPPDAMSKQ